MRPRIRTVKPEVHRDEELWDLGVETGWPMFQAFIGLWNCADREGRFEWRPRALKALVLPYWDGDFARVLDAFATRGFVRRYTVGGRDYGLVRTFTRHQSINNREEESTLPAPPDDEPESPNDPPTPTRGARVDDASATRGAREGHADKAERNGTEGKGTEPLRARAREAAPTPEPEPEPEPRPSPLPKPPDPLPSADTPIERARSLLTRGYAQRIEAVTGDAWMSADANRQAIRDVARWCASKPKLVDERACDVLDGLFADTWMRDNAYPWGPVAKNPAKYADAGRKSRQLAEKRRRREADEARREAARVASQREAEAGAVPPPAEALRAIGRLVGAIGGVPDTGHRERRERRQRELEAQAAQLRAAGGEP